VKFTLTPYRRALLLRLPLRGQDLKQMERRQLNACLKAGVVMLSSGAGWLARFILTEKGRAALAEPEGKPAP
jgi:hypothetical protein